MTPIESFMHDFLRADFEAIYESNFSYGGTALEPEKYSSALKKLEGFFAKGLNCSGHQLHISTPQVEAILAMNIDPETKKKLRIKELNIVPRRLLKIKKWEQENNIFYQAYITNHSGKIEKQGYHQSFIINEENGNFSIISYYSICFDCADGTGLVRGKICAGCNGLGWVHREGKTFARLGGDHQEVMRIEPPTDPDFIGEYNSN
jgi:hypothetical protein